MQVPWKKRNRRQARSDGPGLLERIDWRAVGTVAGLVVGCVAVAALLAFALDRPVRRVLVEGAFLHAMGARRAWLWSIAANGASVGVGMVTRAWFGWP